MDFEKGTQIELEIIDISTEGQGIGKKDGMTVFISRGKEPLVYGDVVLAEIEEHKKRFVKASVKETIKLSAFRNPPSCGYFEECGGCMLQNMTYEGQLALKEKQIKDKYIRLAGIKDPNINPIIGMESPFRYRNKTQIAVGKEGVGFFGTKSHNVVDCKTCSINSRPAEVIAEVVREFMKAHHIPAYDRRTGKGLLRHVVVRTAFGTGEVMVILVVNGKELPVYERLVQMMDEAVYAIEEADYSLESVIFSSNTERASQVLGKKWGAIAGKSTILDTIGNMEFEISPPSFYQVNSIQTEKLYNKVLEYVALTGHETVLDIYCGIGTVGLWCAAKAGKVLGIENNKQAVLDANRNAVINGIVNAQYICGQAEYELPKLVADGLHADVIILDPPRAGCKKELLEAAARTNASRIVYVACDIATQARDIKILTELGYAFVEATPVDMFPWSMDVEAVALLKREGE